MNVFEISSNGTRAADEGSAAQTSYETSPFVAAQLLAPASTTPEFAEFSVGPSAGSLTTPFAESLATFDESDLAAEAFESLRAEFEDEDFSDALEALADEVAARHLTAAGSWGQQSESMQLASSEAEQWMEAVAAQSDRLLGALESHFGERPVEAVTGSEIDAVAGFSSLENEQLGGPLGAQEMFLGKLISKVKKVVSGVGKLVKKGVQAVGKLLPLGKLFGFLKKLVRPLLERVLRKAIGKLPPPLQPIAKKLAARFGGGGAPGAGAPTPAPNGGEPSGQPPATAADAGTGAGAGAGQDASTGESAWSAEALADDFDARLAEAVLSPNEAVANELLAEFEAEVRAGAMVDSPVTALDIGRQRLAQQLVEATPGRPPLAEMEEFIPVVMAAMKFIKLGVKVIGRKRVVDFIAKLLATLIQGMVGAQAAGQLSHHVADAGLRLLGLEAERSADGMLGAEALVAATEDTIREVLAMPSESLDNELLLEAAVQESFTAAAIRHFPPAVLRPDLTEAESDGERGIWLMFPRATRPHFRYKKYSVIQPVLLTRASARSMVLADGETLEDRLLDAGARGWPIPAEAHFYELLPGAEFGHLAAYETESEESSFSATALEFEELAPSRPLPFAHPAHRSSGGSGTPGAGVGHPGGPRRRLQPGTRVVRLKVPGLRLRRRPPFSLRLDLSANKPVLRLHLHISERVAHELIEHVEKQRMVQVVAAIRRLVGGPARQVLADRLIRKLGKRGVTLAEGGGAKLSAALAETMGRAVAKHLPAAAATLSTAAKDPAAGITVTFAFPFADRAAIANAKVGEPTLHIRPGVHRD